MTVDRFEQYHLSYSVPQTDSDGEDRRVERKFPFRSSTIETATSVARGYAISLSGDTELRDFALVDPSGTRHPLDVSSEVRVDEGALGMLAASGPLEEIVG